MGCAVFKKAKELLSNGGIAIVRTYRIVDFMVRIDSLELENTMLKRGLEKWTRETFNQTHCCCPKCGNDKTAQSYVRVVYRVGVPYSDDVNTASCSCGWRGKVNELVGKDGVKVPLEDR